MFYYQSPTSNYFNESWYKNTYNIKENGMLHYSTIGHKLNYNPSIYFNTEWYKTKYNINTNPLEHFCSNKNTKPNELCKYFINSSCIWNSNWVNIKGDFAPLVNEKKRINLLLPSLSISAGPQTIYIFANMLAERGHNVRIISLYTPVDILKFKSEILKRFKFHNNIEIESQFTKDILISYDDIFIASAWWTVYPLKFILGYLNFKKFFWFIQENELLLHCGDETYAKALECYNMDYYSFINTSILKDDLLKINFNIKEYVCFEPAFDRKLFYYTQKQNNKLQIIFYSRDSSIASRNLVKTVHHLLLEAYKNNIINEDNCVVYGFGQNKNKNVICNNFYYEDLGFLDIDSYSELLRNSDILISFQMAPHPSYPPLEMAHCNGVCLHTEFSNKTSESMNRYSDKIILAEPSINKLLEGLEHCINIVKSKNISSNFPKLLHDNWETSLSESYEFLLNKSNCL